MKKRPVNSTRMPVYRDAGFELTDSETTLRAFTKEAGNEHIPDNFIYSRYRNPTVIEAEELLMDIENSKWALLTQSGMSAIDTALSVFQKAGDKRPWLFFSEIYGGTLSYIDYVLSARRGIDVHFFHPDGMGYDTAKLEKMISELKPSLVFFEVVSNPMLITAPAAEITEIIHRHGAVAVIDNTFATAHLIRPLESGADIVIHSATKYLGGHGNITAGALCGNDEQIMNDAIGYRKFTGHMISPDDAYRLNTQMQSFSLRFQKQCDNALAAARLINDSEVVENVYYPGLEDHYTHHLARDIFSGKGYGAIVTFSFAGSSDDEKRRRRDAFIGHVSESIKLVPSLGDSHSILMPVEPIWGDRYPEPGMIRLSVGYEDTERLTDTLKSALGSVS